MAQSTYQSFPNPVPVIGPEFCSPHPIDLVMVKSALTLTETKFVVTDSNGTLMFKVKRFPLSLHGILLIVDSAGRPVATLRRKTFTAHSRWQVFRGESSDIKDLVFTAKKSSLIQMHTNLDIFLPNNNSEETVCDFKVKSGWMSGSCDVYAGETATIAAQVDKQLTAKSILLGKTKFILKVQQNIDYTFILALVTILDDIATRRRQSSTTNNHHKGAGSAASFV